MGRKRLLLCLLLAAVAVGLALTLGSAQGMARASVAPGESPDLPPGLSAADWADISGQIEAQQAAELAAADSVPLSALLLGDGPAQQAYLKASNTGVDDFFGCSVAVSGDTVVVGAHKEDGDATGVNGDQGNDYRSNSGAAYVFVRSGGTWTQQAYLKASNTDYNDYFGYSVAISGDTVVVGAPQEDSSATGVDGNQSNNDVAYAGAVYVFTRDGTTWSQQAYLKASNTGAGDHFGDMVAVSGDTVVVGALFEDSSATGVNGDQSDNGAADSGAVYVFTRDGATWTQQAYLKASNTDMSDNFGGSVGISGGTLGVGAMHEASSASGVNGDQSDDSRPDAGAAYVFVRDGATWSQQAYLKPMYSSTYEYFGCSMAVSGDSVIVGSFQEDGGSTGVNGDQTDNSAANSGAAYVFVRDGTTWSQEAYLKASNTEMSDNFGLDVAISGDTAVVGAWLEDSGATGINGNQADSTGSDSGAAYLFTRSGTAWSQQAYLKASNTGVSDYFSRPVAISGSTVVAGAHAEDSNATGIDGDGGNNSAGDSGAAYVFAGLGTAVDAPTVTGVVPNSGLTTGGESVTITGTGFIDVSEVTFGGVPAASFTVDFDTQITAVSPPHAVDGVEVQVTALGGTSSTSGTGQEFNYTMAFNSIRGVDRFDTALKISQAMFPAASYPSGLPADSGVVLAPGWESYQEALCGAPLAAAYGGPVLLSSKTILYTNVKNELQRLDPDHVFCIGLTGTTVADAVQVALPGATVTSINGDDVYHMSYLVAKALGARVDATGGDISKATGIVTIGNNFPDAIGVSPLACYKKWPVLLTDYNDNSLMHTRAVQAMNELGITSCVKAGTYAPDPTGITGLGNFSGADRYYTNANGVIWAQAYAGLTYTHTALTTGDKFPDALAGGPHLALDHGILLLSPLQGPVPAPIQALLIANHDLVRLCTFIACIEPVISVVEVLLD